MRGILKPYSDPSVSFDQKVERGPSFKTHHFDTQMYWTKYCSSYTANSSVKNLSPPPPSFFLPNLHLPTSGPLTASRPWARCLYWPRGRSAACNAAACLRSSYRVHSVHSVHNYLLPVVLLMEGHLGLALATLILTTFHAIFIGFYQSWSWARDLAPGWFEEMDEQKNGYLAKWMLRKNGRSSGSHNTKPPPF